MDAARERGVTITDLDGAYASAHDAFVEETLPVIIATAEARGVEKPAKFVATFRANLAEWQVMTNGAARA